MNWIRTSNLKGVQFTNFSSTMGYIAYGETPRRNESHKHRYESDSNPQHRCLQHSAPATAVLKHHAVQCSNHSATRTPRLETRQDYAMFTFFNITVTRWNTSLHLGITYFIVPTAQEILFSRTFPGQNYHFPEQSIQDLKVKKSRYQAHHNYLIYDQLLTFLRYSLLIPSSRYGHFYLNFN